MHVRNLFLNKKNGKKDYWLIKPQLARTYYQSKYLFSKHLVKMKESEVKKIAELKGGAEQTHSFYWWEGSWSEKLSDLYKITLLNSERHGW